MSEQFFTAKYAAMRLGITVATFYDWLGQSDCGLLVIRGEKVTVRYYQGGRQGQGRIRIEADEIERLRELMRVVPQRRAVRGPAVRHDRFPGIHVPLGRPATSEP